MAQYLSEMSHHDPAMNELAFCDKCRAIFLTMAYAKTHEDLCQPTAISRAVGL